MTKPTKWLVRPAKTQISLGIRPVWSESSLCAQWVAKDPSFLHADSEDSDQTGRMTRLIWVFAGRTGHFVGFVVRRLISPSSTRQFFIPTQTTHVFDRVRWTCRWNVCMIFISSIISPWPRLAMTVHWTKPTATGLTVSRQMVYPEDCWWRTGCFRDQPYMYVTYQLGQFYSYLKIFSILMINSSLLEQRVICIDIKKIFVTLFHHTVTCAVQQLFHNTMFLFKQFFFPDISSLQCYSFCLCWGLTSQSTIFQSCRDGQC